ncbi:hypothetical protein GEMRC1_004460 [Eukaryota sp. GEM-RC1]
MLRIRSEQLLLRTESSLLEKICNLVITAIQRIIVALNEVKYFIGGEKSLIEAETKIIEEFQEKEIDYNTERVLRAVLSLPKPPHHEQQLQENLMLIEEDLGEALKTVLMDVEGINHAPLISWISAHIDSDSWATLAGVRDDEGVKKWIEDVFGQ